MSICITCCNVWHSEKNNGQLSGKSHRLSAVAMLFVQRWVAILWKLIKISIFNYSLGTWGGRKIEMMVAIACFTTHDVFSSPASLLREAKNNMETTTTITTIAIVVERREGPNVIIQSKVPPRRPHIRAMCYKLALIKWLLGSFEVLCECVNVVAFPY